jgi:hypothetical protein
MATAISSVRSFSFGKVWAGRVLSAIPVLMLLLSASMKLSHAPSFVAAWTERLGWSESALTTIGLLELAVAVLYVIPRTAFFGAVLVTAYLGGAVATDARVGNAVVVPIVLGVFAWLGLYLRDARVAVATRIAGAASDVS